MFNGFMNYNISNILKFKHLITDNLNDCKEEDDILNKDHIVLYRGCKLSKDLIAKYYSNQKFRFFSWN